MNDKDFLKMVLKAAAENKEIERKNEDIPELPWGNFFYSGKEGVNAESKMLRAAYGMFNDFSCYLDEYDECYGLAGYPDDLDECMEKLMKFISWRQDMLG